jgi:hypothetical protein
MVSIAGMDHGCIHEEGSIRTGTIGANIIEVAHREFVLRR